MAPITEQTHVLMSKPFIKPHFNAVQESKQIALEGGQMTDLYAMCEGHGESKDKGF